MEFWDQKTFCLVTGASRGFGKAIAIEFSKKVSPGSVFLLLARSGKLLEETKTEILAHENNPVHVTTAAIDLAKPNSAEYFSLINSALASSGNEATDFEHYILVHNAATMGNVKLQVTQVEDLAELRQYYDCNLLSMILLTSQFLKIFSDSSKQRSVVQISSLAALQPVKNCGLYCAGKAARDMVMRSIAAEEPSISTISYAPGAVDTDMYEYTENNVNDEEIRSWFKSVKTTHEFQTPVEAVTKLIRVLEVRKYVKGEHVDYSAVAQL